jgi:hypothetical protein
MAKRKRTIGQTLIYKTIHKKLKMEQHELNEKRGKLMCFGRVIVPAPRGKLMCFVRVVVPAPHISCCMYTKHNKINRNHILGFMSYS